ncbi:MAG: clostripain-related cysteine peptidase, partial [Myxococcota bacterium]
HANVMVASSEKEPQQGWPYDVVLAPLASVPSTSATSWASWTVDAYHQASPLHYTLSAVDLQAVADLDDEVSALADALAAHPSLFPSIEGVRQEAQGFGDPAFRDMLDLSIRLGQMPGAPGEVVAASDALAVALQGAILHNRAQASHLGANGLSIYLPPSGGGLDCAYFDNDALWSASTRWDDLLAAFCHADCGI